MWVLDRILEQQELWPQAEEGGVGDREEHMEGRWGECQNLGCVLYLPVDRKAPEPQYLLPDVPFSHRAGAPPESPRYSETAQIFPAQGFVTL